MKSKAKKPTESELNILKILWSQGPMTVREVHERLGGSTGYTTALKLLQIMTKKGVVVRDKRNRAHVYSAVLDETKARREAVDSLAGKFFGGSALQLAMHALGQGEASSEDLREIRTLIDGMEKKSPKPKK